MVRRAPFLLFALLGACASSENPSLARLETQVRQLREEQDRQGRTIDQLNHRVVLAEDTVRQGRAGVVPPAARGTVAIRDEETAGGAAAMPAEPPPAGAAAANPVANNAGARPAGARLPLVPAAQPAEEEDDAPPANAPGARPSIRLQGREAGPQSNAPPIVVRENERLPVVPVAPAPVPGGVGPSAQIDPAALPALSSARDPQASPAYERAVSLARSRQCPQAVEAFSTFLVQWPDHPYASNAMYWRGACILESGEPERAAREFEGLLNRFPTAQKAPDALYKLVQCYRRLGDRSRARAAAERLLREHPSASVADRLRTEGMP